MKKILLLSSPDKRKGYIEDVKEIINKNLSGKRSIICISANPDKYEKNDKQVYGKDDSLGIIKMLGMCGVKIENTYLIDNRNIKEFDKNLFLDVDIIYFMGGDPLLQNQFVIDNDLLEYIKMSDAFIIGVSAGSMNLAENTFIPKYELNDKARFIKGFGLCNYSIVPHYDIHDLMQVNEVKENCCEHNLIGLPNESAIYINGDIVEFVNDYYLYNSK